jgi:hypothetical protein
MLGDQAFFLLMSSIILLIDMIQEAFVEAHPMSSTFFESNDSMNAQQMLEFRHVLLFIALHEYQIMCTLSLLSDDLSH